MQKEFIAFSQLNVSISKKRDIIEAEVEILRATEFIVPIFTSYDVIDIIFGRLMVFSKEKSQDTLAKAKRLSDDALLTEILEGRDCGFQTAKFVSEMCLKQCGFDKWGYFDEAVLATGDA
jgi:hypothetical protein